MGLAPYAMDIARSRGRRFPESPHPYRNDYARDRDRVIHSRAFRRLEAKTQVFTARFSDHFRNRLTHTLEVAQIARTIAGALGLNSDLAEALALVHDIGHPPFGHAGEKALDEHMHAYGEGFNHNLHALRIVEQFERRYLDFAGLNLTFEVREGILKHSRDWALGELPPQFTEYLLHLRPPLEAQLIDLVDEIAYNTADLDDGLEASLVELAEIRRHVPLFGEAYQQVDRRYPYSPPKLKFNEALKHVLDTLATNLIENTGSNIKHSGVASVEDVRKHQERLVAFSAAMAEHNAQLKRFLFEQVYESRVIVEDRSASVAALHELFLLLVKHPEKMPSFYAQLARVEPPHRVVCDYIAGMTDHFLLRQYRDLRGTAVAVRF